MTEMSELLSETLNIQEPDDLYEMLIAAHRGLSMAQSLKLNAKLIFLLANHIGNLEVIRGAIAKATGVPNSSPSPR